MNKDTPPGTLIGSRRSEGGLNAPLQKGDLQHSTILQISKFLSNNNQPSVTVTTQPIMTQSSNSIAPSSMSRMTAKTTSAECTSERNPKSEEKASLSG